MDIQLMDDLAMCHTDLAGAMQRFSGNEKLYISCLKNFLSDPTMDNLRDSVCKACWDDAFTAAHALKGVAGNMGFISLYHATGELVILIRNGKIDEISASLSRVEASYNELTRVIKRLK